jgi:hypothetical protein
MLTYQDLPEHIERSILLTTLCALKLLLGIVQRYLLNGVALAQHFDLVWASNNMLLLPGHIEFAETLANLPFFYKEMAKNTCEVMHVIQSHPNHLPEIADVKRLQEYLQSGEIDEFVEYIDGYADVDEPTETEKSDNCLTSLELSDQWFGSI